MISCFLIIIQEKMQIINELSSVKYNGTVYCYDEIVKNCSLWIDILKKFNINSLEKVVVYAEVNDKILFLILALLSTKACYVPIDADTPITRVKEICKQTNSKLIITNEKNKDLIDGDIEQFYIENFELKNDISESYCNEWGEGIAYCIFTSGSTGKPKGVMIEKSSLYNFVVGTERMNIIGNCSTVLCVTSISFDIFGFETVFALNQGKQVVIANKEQKSNPRALLNLIYDEKIECIQVTPSRLRMLYYMDNTFSKLKEVKTIVVGGEKFPEDLVYALKENLKADIYNGYGPTESTIYSSYALVDSERIDIGVPIINVRYYILDENLKIIEDDLTGELYISGKSLAKGYINNERETNNRFVHIDGICELVYKTGDLCKKNNGKFYWLGRTDNQVKVNGYRIELEEVESVLCLYSEVKEALAYLHYSANNEKKFLAAAVVTTEKFNKDECIRYVRSVLPDYMVPVIIKHVDKFPHTLGGKIDRKKVIANIKEN